MSNRKIWKKLDYIETELTLIRGEMNTKLNSIEDPTVGAITRKQKLKAYIDKYSKVILAVGVIANVILEGAIDWNMFEIISTVLDLLFS